MDKHVPKVCVCVIQVYNRMSSLTVEEEDGALSSWPGYWDSALFHLFCGDSATCEEYSYVALHE